ncbi:hypothetical protein OKJ48_03515 [Streptomyces kunmingensis]|uniref:Membrane-bound hydrophilic protein n=1 Tax=Streptomyces kunmingensis TaxID=68225 RepID=A0ABU6C446_9ACTN|nr:hypothetical protein [Streptomyces kunmingensis]MEB3959323.1 hypothetical protein [Streptomyces kunmingensis]
MPAGKAIAIAAMPTAVLMGIGLTPTLALAEDNPTKFSVDDYKACADAVQAERDAKSGKTATDDKADDKDKDKAQESPSASESTDKDAGKDTDKGEDTKDEATPSPSASASGGSGSSADEESKDGKAAQDTATPSPSASETKNPLDPLGLGDALKDLFAPKDKETAGPTPSPSASASESGSEDGSKDGSKDLGDAVKDTVDGVGDTVKDTTDKAGDAVKDTTDGLDKAAEDAKKKAEEAATPSPSASGVPDNCPVATDAEGDNENTPVQLPDKPWQLEASSLTLKGADYQGIVNVKMADGSTKRVMKYVISNGTDIGDLHQIAPGPNGKSFHIRSDKGSTSTIRDGKTTMYTEELSGNLLGLIPMTFNADNPPPINLPILYFTNVKVTQAAQFGGTLHVPGLTSTIEDS